MTLANLTIPAKIAQQGQRYVELFEQQHGFKPVCEQDPNWPSPCEGLPYDQQHNHWQPVAITEPLSFANVEQALELTLHPSIKEYYTAVYSESITGECADGQLSLLFAWSEADFARLQENIIGHILMKKRLKQAVTVFFGVTDQEDYILSVDNDSGEVWVERVGCQPHKKLANSMLEFLEQITIVPPST